jgi:hypothetical protein
MDGLMEKITTAQQKALDSLIAIGAPATSQQIGVQIDSVADGRECEAILWQAV